jgi:hypothetical protein
MRVEGKTMTTTKKTIKAEWLDDAISAAQKAWTPEEIKTYSPAIAVRPNPNDEEYLAGLEWEADVFPQGHPIPAGWTMVARAIPTASGKSKFIKTTGYTDITG